MKDYYAILGVTRQAEDIVIRAAYKALAQRYHPDRYEGSVEDANCRMAELNEAYDTLSDPHKRRKYDEEYDSTVVSEAQGYEEQDQAADEAGAQLASDWSVATEFYPDLIELDKDLCKTSKRLSLTYRIVLLANKDYKNRRLIAEKLHTAFLESYFGSNTEILAFARRLIDLGERDAARALNRAVSVLGSDTDPEIVIDRITTKFNLKEKYVESIEDELAKGKAQFLNNSPASLALFKAIRAHDTGTVERLLRQDRLLVGVRDGGNGNTPLHCAIAERDIPIALLLIDSGAPLQWRNLFGVTPLDFVKKEPGMDQVAVEIQSKI